MNKITLAILMLFSIELLGQSKISMNVSGGFVSSSQQFVTPDGGLIKFKPITGISASVGLEYGLHRHWAVAGNVQYIEKGSQRDGANVVYELRLRHLSISPMAIFRHSIGKERFQVGLGPNLSLFTSFSSNLFPDNFSFQKVQFGLQSHLQVTHSFKGFEIGVRGLGYYDLNSAFDVPNSPTTTNLGWGMSLVGIYNLKLMKNHK